MAAQRVDCPEHGVVVPTSGSGHVRGRQIRRTAESKLMASPLDV